MNRSVASMAVLAVAAACGVSIPAVASAADAAPNLYVDNRPGIDCSDSGLGTSAQPYCTVGAAAAVAVPGQTVLIAGSTYDEHLDITRSGTPGSPITFEQNPAISTGVEVSLQGAGAGITVAGQHDVTFSTLQVQGTGNTGISLTDSSRITLRSVFEGSDSDDPAGIRLAGVSDSTLASVHVTANANNGISLDRQTSGVTIESSMVNGNGQKTVAAAVEISGTSNKLVDSTIQSSGIGVVIDDGASGTVVVNNIVRDNLTAGIDNVDAGGTAITSNTVSTNCTGILIRGASTGVSVENNISTGNDLGYSACPILMSDRVDVGVYDAAESSTTVDYNIGYTYTAGAGTYAWGAPVASLAAFQAASGQGAHDIDANPRLDATTSVPADGSPEVDSADTTAPGVQVTDAHGFAAENEPYIPDTGTGPVTYRDRGAVELTKAPFALLHLTSAVPTATSGWQFTADASKSIAPWSPLTTYTFDFGDGTVVTQATPVATHTYTQLGSHDVTLTVKDAEGMTGTSAMMAKVGNTYTPLGPVRVLDTRSRIGVSTTTPVAPGATVSLQIAGVAGVPASQVSAVVLNVTATQPTKGGFLTVYPDGQARPGTSSLDWVPGVSVPNLVTVPVVDGRVDFFNGSSGTVHVLADLAGYFGTDVDGGIYFPQGPTRLLDTRSAIGVPTSTAVAPGATVSLQVSGVAGVPGSAIDATLNVTVTQPTKSGYLTAYPDGQTRPGTSNLDWSPGQTIANLVTVPLPNSGKVDFYNGSSGTVHILADLAGYYRIDVGSDSDAGALYEPAKPVRVLDTRDGTGTGTVGPIPPGGALVLSLANYPVNYLTGTNNGLLVNVTVTNPKTAGFLTVYPEGQSRPLASNLDWAPGQTIANLVSVPLPASGRIVLYNGGGSGTVDVIADLVGSYQH